MGIQGCQQKEEEQPDKLNVCNIIVEGTCFIMNIIGASDFSAN